MKHIEHEETRGEATLQRRPRPRTTQSTSERLETGPCVVVQDDDLAIQHGATMTKKRAPRRHFGEEGRQEEGRQIGGLSTEQLPPPSANAGDASRAVEFRLNDPAIANGRAHPRSPASAPVVAVAGHLSLGAPYVTSVRSPRMNVTLLVFACRLSRRRRPPRLATLRVQGVAASGQVARGCRDAVGTRDASSPHRRVTNVEHH